MPLWRSSLGFYRMGAGDTVFIKEMGGQRDIFPSASDNTV